MEQHMVGALPGTYPISVAPGETVRLNRVRFEYRGPSGALYIHWGLKAGYGDFNNGDNLEGRVFAWAMVSVPAASSWIVVDNAVGADLPISSDIRTGRTYDTYVWLATRAGTTQETDILLIDTDASIVSVAEIPTRAEARGLQVGYTKV